MRGYLGTQWAAPRSRTRCEVCHHIPQSTVIIRMQRSNVHVLMDGYRRLRTVVCFAPDPLHTDLCPARTIHPFYNSSNCSRILFPCAKSTDIVSKAGGHSLCRRVYYALDPKSSESRENSPSLPTCSFNVIHLPRRCDGTFYAWHVLLFVRASVIHRP